MRFYLWGPSSTGKTWLFDSFIRKVNLIDEALAKQQPKKFSIWIDNQLSMRQHRYSLSQEATSDIDYQEFTFHREYYSQDNKDKTRIACSHDHVFMMMDGPGDETTGAVLQEANTDENRAKVLAAHEALKDADCLMVCVERGLRDLANQNAGQHFVERLRALLNLNRKQDQEIVICFTKSDIHGGRVAGFDSALGRLFGAYGQEVGHLLRELNGLRYQPPHYFVSAVGYYHDPKTGKIVANFDPGASTLKEQDNWLPDRVEEPFFKLLTDAEKKMLSETKSDAKNIFSKLTSNFLTENLRKDLINAYIDYDTMLKTIKIRAR